MVLIVCKYKIKVIHFKIHKDNIDEQLTCYINVQHKCIGISEYASSKYYMHILLYVCMLYVL